MYVYIYIFIILFNSFKTLLPKPLRMCLLLSANVYCLVRGEFSTNGKGLLLTSNSTTDKAGTHRTVPGGGFSVFSGDVGPLAKTTRLVTNILS